MPNHAPRLAPLHILTRLAGSLAIAAALMGGSLAIGVVGYHHLAGMPWIDALLNASMILGGMGPVDTLTTNSAKVFASAYALYSGLILIAAISIALSPLAHRILHKFHLDETDLKSAEEQEQQAR
ncbi:MAG: hypothetical protein H0W83_01275 [Planctomycetes bacterium]|nr:hypothetical protein [Planctomycetota bacterium]